MKKLKYIQPEVEQIQLQSQHELAAGSNGKTNVDDYTGQGQGGTGIEEETGEGEDDDDPDAKVFNVWDTWN